ncbi:hypothetical protein AQUCO_02500283v1 [Aquilegia coerulea]|uniref:Bidirectional sugar transporter SWEET n=1 Tax=Aquilegia coerulea TaxID=218851 RepID=A0A2G5DAH3_AQUCA|nr:hypothetical protein AQUCO_02500283v1 [Aquilegia coerulea]
MWVFYGLPFVTGNNTLVISINSVGLFLEVCYVVGFIYYCHTNKQRVNVGFKGIGIAVIFALAAFFELYFDKSKTTRKLVAGIQSTVFSVCLYAMPLDVMRTVIKTKSAEYMPFPLCCAGFANGIVWSIYALMSKPVDIYILIANGIGAILGAVQIMLWLVYRNGPKAGEKPTQNKAELSSEDSIV